MTFSANDAGEASSGPVGSQNALPNGTRLDQFEIVELIGEGGFGIVYLAQDHTLHRRVALKEYLPSTLAGRAAGSQVVLLSEQQRETFRTGLRSFVNEARILARYDHPALIKVYQFWEANGTAYMAMPFLSGRNLRDVVAERGPMPDESWIAAILAPLMDALQLIHADNCYHRDISPDNIMLLAGDRPVLLDFGAARQVINDMTRALTVMLKPGYAPIEQYADLPGSRQGAWTDIYALGAVVHFMIRGDKPPSSVSRMIKDNYKPLAAGEAGHYSARFLQGIDRCLAVKPEDRPQTIAEMRALIGFDTKVAAVAHPKQAPGTVEVAEKDPARFETLPAAETAVIDVSTSVKERSGGRRRIHVFIGLAIGIAIVGVTAFRYFKDSSTAVETVGASPGFALPPAPAPVPAAAPVTAPSQGAVSPSAAKPDPEKPPVVPAPASNPQGARPADAPVSASHPGSNAAPATTVQAASPKPAPATAPAMPVTTSTQGSAPGSAVPDATIPRPKAAEPSNPASKEAPASNTSERGPGTLFRDCPDCPDLVVIPPGVFEMGSPASEEGRRKNEGPVHQVALKAFAIGRTEVTRGQYAAFVAATAHPSGNDCWLYNGEKWLKQEGKSWRDPGFRQEDNHPVVCVSWDDAQAYASWLSTKTGKRYRLPSESEWEYAARAGTRMAQPWSGVDADACNHANLASENRQFTLFGLGNQGSPNCRDKYPNTAPTGAMKANGFGLYDVIGNASEWVEDCFDGSYVGAPADGGPRTAKPCSGRVIRGGSWDVSPVDARFARRDFDVPSTRLDGSGFRVVRTLP